VLLFGLIWSLGNKKYELKKNHNSNNSNTISDHRRWISKPSKEGKRFIGGSSAVHPPEGA
jgi:hypothetical protein